MLKQHIVPMSEELNLPAAFRRLCVETAPTLYRHGRNRQPPSGGCVLKQTTAIIALSLTAQPPSGGCVLKLHRQIRRDR